MKTYVAFALLPQLDFRNGMIGEFVANTDGTFSCRVLSAPGIPGTGPWLSQDSAGNWSRKDDVGQDEKWAASTMGSMAVAFGRGQEPVLPYFTPITVWAQEAKK